MKTLILVVIVILASMILLSQQVKATDIARLEIEMDGQVKKNDEIIVKIKVGGTDKGILGIQGTLVYDKEVFEILEAKVNNENFRLMGFGEDTGTFMIEITDEAFYHKEAYIYDEEMILELKVKVKDTANTKKTTVELKDGKVVDSEFQTTEVTPINQVISIRNTNEQENIIRNGILIGVVLVLVLVLVIGFIRKKNKTR